TLEKITFNATYGNERIIAFLYLPKNVLPPYQTVIYFPGGGVLRGGSIEDNHRHLYRRLEFMIKNGRAVLSPVYIGTWERSDPDIHEIYYPNESHAHTEFMIKLIKDFSRSIDYLESRSDIDSNKLAYYGHS
ncbi:MAG: hypothetical protein KAQ79_09120, partial [Cyclobacteriaceae bacterium]|nr:hypothetical protein [Cyclobacteriaceae bacterium]